MNNKYLFAGLGQYNKAIQTIFKMLCIFKENLIGGWLDTQENIFITELAIILRLTKFNKFLVKLFLKREKEFLLTSNFTFNQGKIEDFPQGFTKFSNRDTFIIPSNLDFVEFKKL